MHTYGTRLARLLVIASLLLPGSAQSEKQLKPVPAERIDCNSSSQPCTGTACVRQQAEFYCASTDTTFVCPNDSQNYVGGDQICCTGKNPCYSCPYNGRNIPYYNYNGGDVACVPNH